MRLKNSDYAKERLTFHRSGNPDRILEVWLIWNAHDDATGLEGSGEVSWVLDRSVHGSVMIDVGRVLMVLYMKSYKNNTIQNKF